MKRCFSKLTRNLLLLASDSQDITTDVPVQQTEQPTNFGTQQPISTQTGYTHSNDGWLGFTGKFLMKITRKYSIGNCYGIKF